MGFVSDKESPPSLALIEKERKSKNRGAVKKATNLGFENLKSPPFFFKVKEKEGG